MRSVLWQFNAVHLVNKVLVPHKCPYYVPAHVFTLHVLNDKVIKKP
jgi:hypothetical protein